jgi:hypothetical protein
VPEEHDADFGLVMPFVVCASVGGPFEDDAFVAGYECGRIDSLLEQGREPDPNMPVRTMNVRQLDLIAMRRGYVLVVTTSPADEAPDDEWAFVRFERVTVDAS